LGPEAGRWCRSRALRPTRVHGVGEAAELDNVFVTVSVVSSGLVALDYRWHYIGVGADQLQSVEVRPTLCFGRRPLDLLPFVSS